MRKKISRMVAVMLAVVLAFGMVVPAFAADANTDAKLKFNNGKLKIVVFADCQDDCFPDGRMIKMMQDALDAEKPDLVIFTGDNVSQDIKPLNRAAIRLLLEPVVSRNIPFAITFGNHDGEHFSKEQMLAFYQELPGCLSYDAMPELYGCGTCNIPVYSSDGSEIAYNIWMIDSNMYDAENGGYDHVHQDQIDWFKATDAALEAQVGHKVNSMVFQHIVVPEVYACLKEADATSEKVMNYGDRQYMLELNETASGYLGEFPCPPTVNGGEFDAFVERGDVVGIVTGHDHVNSFIGSYKNISFIQFPGATFQSYGSDAIRGYGVINIDESATDTFEAYSVQYSDMYADQTKLEDSVLVANQFFASLKYVFAEILASFKELFQMLKAA